MEVWRKVKEARNEVREVKKEAKAVEKEAKVAENEVLEAEKEVVKDQIQILLHHNSTSTDIERDPISLMSFLTLKLTNS